MLSLCSQAGTILWASFPENVDIISGWGSRHFSRLSSENKQAILRKNFQSILQGSLPWSEARFESRALAMEIFVKDSPHITHGQFSSRTRCQLFSPDFCFTMSVALMPTSELSGSVVYTVKSREEEVLCCT